ncbi:LacI family DNA-binding transcriptional regulator [Dictyobacter arantiisoli]|uniref:LacI family transcriptional regulator n=1 Tax=Dictyobacter arantiisoli TaxID=2014874 RepID=A0A5A5TKI9_9CHLR|nr:LacI family DNA-binding transcriptional regulator [Dictyobacter arantiisoli]GCF11569.1 LacI family transcriptional regulator [Dictyobacter arantiisoli]
MGITIVDVAKRAGVTVSTVSYTLSGKRPVSEQARARVLQAIEELHYEPHALGQALRSKRTHTIGILYPAAGTGLSSLQLEFIEGASTVTTERNYGLYLWLGQDQNRDVLQMMKRGIIEGVILMEIRMKDPRIAFIKEQGYPFVMIGHGPDNSPENDGTSFVDLNFPAALRTSVEYLAELGHQDIVFLNISTAMNRGAAYAIRATQGFEQSIARLGLQGQTYPCPPDPQKGYELVRSILEEKPTLTGIITTNSWVVGSILRAVQEHGLHIPEDFSVVTMLPSHLAEMMHPAMTSIDFPYKEIGRIAAEMLIRQLDEPHALPTQTLLQVPLSIRQSSGPYKPRG